MLLENYFKQTKFFVENSFGGDDFYSGLVFMNRTLSRVDQEKLTLSGLAEILKNDVTISSFDAKIGALSFLEGALYKNYDNSKEKSITGKDLDKMLANAANYLRGDSDWPEELGVCRDYSAIVSELAEKGFGLNASTITSARHELVQIKNQGRITLLDRGMLISSLDGHPLVTKNDVDAALIRAKQEPTISDLTIEAGGHKVLYENRYNNFAGLFSKLTNRDNISLRAPEFIDGQNELDLFPRLSEAGVTRGTIEKGNIGAQAYWVRGNNEYHDFLESVKGLNLAAYVPAEFSLAKTKFDNIFFANLGFYRSVLNLTAENGGRVKTADANVSLENYLRCSLNTSLTAGLIAKLADLNREITRTGQPISDAQKVEYRGSLSPFIKFEIPSGKEHEGQTYLCGGAELTNHLALPNLKQISTVPWFQAGFEYNKAEIDLGLRLRGEF